MKSKRVLFIHSENINHQKPDIQYAPSLLSQMHFSLLQRIYGEENVFFLKLEISFVNFFFLFLILLFKKTPSRLLPLSREIEDKNIQEIYFANSFYGVVIGFCKRKYHSIKTIAFFHNLEANTIKKFHENRKLKYSPFASRRIPLLFQKKLIEFLVFFFEKKTVLSADLLITLTKRDRSLLLKFYPHCHPDKVKILPASLPEEVRKPIPEKPVTKPFSQKECIRLLMVSSDWLPNVEGLRFFIEKVVPHLPGVSLDVAGKICMTQPDMPHHDQVTYHGYLPSLEELYRETHFVVMPIFWGGGMKMKVVQALQFGKTIFATSEAFTGYTITPEIGEVCDNSADFIEKITYWIKNKKTQKWNPASRKLYETEYHPVVLEKKLKTMLQILDTP